VYGLAADISATHLNSQANTILAGAFGVPASVSADIDWYGTIDFVSVGRRARCCSMVLVAWLTAGSLSAAA